MATMLYVAVVVRKDRLPSGREDGSWAAFTGATEQEAVTDAMAHARLWNGGRHHYTVLAGQLTSEARERSQYDLVPLKPPYPSEEDF